MNSVPSSMYLVPAALATAFYTSGGIVALRLTALGMFATWMTRRLTKSSLPSVVFCVFAAIQLMTSYDQSQNLFYRFDAVALFALSQALVGLLALVFNCLLTDMKSRAINMYFVCNFMCSLSFGMSVCLLATYFFKSKQMVVFLTLSGASVRMVFEVINSQNFEFYDTETIGAGFGVQQAGAAQTLKSGQTYPELLKGRYSLLTGATSLCLAVFVPIAFALAGGFFGSAFVGIAIILLTAGGLILAFAGALSLMKRRVSVRNLFKKKEVQEQLLEVANEDESKNKAVNNQQEVIEDGRKCAALKSAASQLKQSFQLIVWFVLLFAAVNLGIYATRSQVEVYAWFSHVGFCYIAAAALLSNDPYLTIFALVLTVCSWNYQLPAVIFLGLLAGINALERRPCSTSLLYCALWSCVEFSQAREKWIPALINITLLCPPLVPYLQISKLGSQVSVFLTFFGFDLLVSLPRQASRGIVINGLVLVAFLVYRNRYLLTAVGENQSLVLLSTVVIRVVGNVFTSVLRSDGVYGESQKILKTVIQFYGLFISIACLAVQILSYLRFGDRVSKWKYLLLLPLFGAVAVLIAITPLFVVFADLIIYVTGFSGLLQFNSRSSALQQLTVQLYKIFYQNQVTDFGFILLLWITRSLIGIFVSALIFAPLNIKYAGQSKLKQQLNVENLFEQFLYAAAAAVFVALPSCVIQMQEVVEFDVLNDVLIVVIFVGIVFLPLLKGGVVTKILFWVAFVALLAFCLLTSHFSEGFTLFVFLIALASLPQSFVVGAYVIGILFLNLFLNSRYSTVVISYSSAVATFAAMTTCFLVRLEMAQYSCIRRLSKRLKVEVPGLKLNPRAFDVAEGELDVFLQSANAEVGNPELQQREDAGQVFASLEAQMYVFLALAGLQLALWSFDAFSCVLLGLCGCLLPLYRVGGEGEQRRIVQIAGYFGVGEPYQLNGRNRLQLIQRFALVLFALLAGRFAFDNAAFWVRRLVYGGSEGTTAALIDLGMAALVLPSAFVGLTVVSAVPRGLFAKLADLQKTKLLTALFLVCMAAAIFCTSKALQMLPLFVIAAVLFPAPAAAGAEDSKRVVMLDLPPV